MPNLLRCLHASAGLQNEAMVGGGQQKGVEQLQDLSNALQPSLSSRIKVYIPSSCF